MFVKIFVLACISFALTALADENYQGISTAVCPYCYGKGDSAKDAKNACMEELTTEPCNERNLCAEFSGPHSNPKKKVHQFFCLNPSQYDDLKASCEVDGCVLSKVQLGIFPLEGQKAKRPSISGITQNGVMMYEEYSEELMCPDCYGEGDDTESAKKDCYSDITTFPCKEERPVCAEIRGNDMFELLCASEEYYNKMKARCEATGTCEMSKVGLMVAHMEN